MLTEEWTPFNYIAHDQIVGISTELVEKSLALAGYDYDIQLLPWQRAYRIALSEKNSLLYTTNRTSQRESLFKWIGPLFALDVNFYRLDSRGNILVKSVEDLTKYSIGVSQGGSIEGYLNEIGLKENADYFTYGDESQGLKMLESGHVDLIPGSPLNFNKADQKVKLKKAFTLKTTKYYIAANKNLPDHIVKDIQSALDNLIKQGEKQKILARYFGLVPAIK